MTRQGTVLCLDTAMIFDDFSCFLKRIKLFLKNPKKSLTFGKTECIILW